MISSSAQPLISVLTVTRNPGSILDVCLESVAAQTGISWEHWIIDGASTDGTVEYLRQHPHPRRQWLSEPDRGLYDAMNKAVRLAQGQWLYFLGADDRLRPDVLQLISAKLRDPQTIYYGDVWMIKQRRRYDGRFSRLKLAIKNICQQAIFYPRAVFESFSFDLAYSVQADWVLNMACRNDPRFAFQYLPLIVADFNDADGISSRQRDLAIERDYVRLLCRYFPPWIHLPLVAAVGIRRRLRKGSRRT